jgi:hypothetical protein
MFDLHSHYQPFTCSAYVLQREAKLSAEQKTEILSGPMNESKRSLNSYNVKMEAVGSTEMLVRIHHLTWNHIRCEGFKSSSISFDFK